MAIQMKQIVSKLIIAALLFSSCENDDPKSVLLNDIKELGFPKNEVAISFEQYFNGNKIIGSIGANLDPEIQPEEFYEILKKIKTNKKTESIFVRIIDLEGEWPSSDAVYIIGDWKLVELKKQTLKLQPDEIIEGFMYDKPSNISVGENKVFTLWWD